MTKYIGQTKWLTQKRKSKMARINNNVYTKQAEFDRVEVLLQDMVNTTALLVENSKSAWDSPRGDEIYSSTGDPIVETMYSKLLDVSLAALKEFHAQKSLRIASDMREGDEDSYEDFRPKWLLNKIVDIDGQVLEISPEDIESFDFSLPVEIEELGNGVRKQGQRSFILNIKFKEGSKGPRWTQSMEVVE